jgi:hypothetical protein
MKIKYKKEFLDTMSKDPGNWKGPACSSVGQSDFIVLKSIL